MSERKNYKHLLATFGLMFLVILGLFGLGTPKVQAEGEPTPWDGSVDTSWYTEAGDDALTYHIETAEDLAGLAAIVNGTAEGIEANTFEGKMVVLTADLDLGGTNSDGVWDGQNWSPIGTSSTTFKGFFNGKNHTISNLYVKSTSDNVGLFGLTSGATLKNLRLAEGFVETSGNYAGGLAGQLSNNISLENIISSITVKGGSYAGGITGRLSAGSGATLALSDCVVTANIFVKSNNGLGGGIVGYFGTANKAFQNCYHIGKVESDQKQGRLAGISGQGVNNPTFKNCYHVGPVVSTAEGAKVTSAPIVSGTGKVENCYYSSEDNYSEATKGLKKKPEELKALATTLGDAFTNDSENINQGYPILKCQLGAAESNPVITVKFNHGEAKSGSSLQDVVEDKLEINPAGITFYEITEGTFTAADRTYMQSFFSATPTSIIVAKGVNSSDAFPEGVSFSAGTSAKSVERVEAYDVDAIKKYYNGAGKGMLWAPGAKIVRSGAFNSTKIISISLPSLEKIESKGFASAKELKHLVLPESNVVSVDNSDAFTDVPEDRTLWVPKNLVDNYLAAGSDGKWYGFEVKAMPGDCASLTDMVNYFVDSMDVGSLTLAQYETLLLAEDLYTGMPYADINDALITKLAELRAKMNELRAAEVVAAIQGLKSPEAVTSDDETAIMTAQELFKKLSDDQRALVSEEDQTKLNDCMLQLRIGQGHTFVFGADDYLCYGSSVANALENGGLTISADQHLIKNLTFYLGDYANEDFAALIKAFSARTNIVVKEKATLNNGHLLYETFRQLGSLRYVEMPDIVEIYKGAIWNSSSAILQLNFPNVVKIHEGALTASNNYLLNNFMP